MSSDTWSTSEGFDRSAARCCSLPAWRVLTWAWLFCAGTVLTFNVQNNYNTYRFGGHKVTPPTPLPALHEHSPEAASAATTPHALPHSRISVSPCSTGFRKLNRQKHGVMADFPQTHVFEVCIAHAPFTASLFRQHQADLAASAAQTLVVSTNSWMGGKNLFLGVCYLVVAGLALIVSVTFLLTYHLGCFGMVKRRKFGDVSQLSWNRNIAHR